MTNTIGPHFNNEQLVFNFFQLLEEELTYDGGVNQYNLIRSHFEALKNKEPTFTFPELQEMLLIQETSSRGNPVELKTARNKVKTCVDAFFSSDQIEN